MAKGDDSTRIFGGLKAPMSPFRLDPGLREPIRHKLDGGLKSFMDAFQQPLASDLKGPIRAAKDVGNLNTFAALRNGLDAFSPDRHKKIRNPSPLEDKEHLKVAIRQNGPAALLTPPPPPVIVVPVEQVIKALALAQSVSPDPAPRSTPAAKRNDHEDETGAGGDGAHQVGARADHQAPQSLSQGSPSQREAGHPRSAARR